MLSRKQRDCIALLQSGLLLADACDAVGVSVRTAQRWQKDPEFIKHWDDKQMQALDSAMATSQPQPERNLQSPPHLNHLARSWIARAELREKELSLLNSLEEKMLAQFDEDKSNLRIVDRLLKLSERRSKLLGLDFVNTPTLAAMEMLVREQIIPMKHAEMIYDSLRELEDKLCDC